ncbi:DUF1870 family protein [Psychromicrobium lacuslunae]|uniref:Aca2/YdiL-like domain-containing protein n=1 Tax=Psychromicrobium lacuslunae TaxID=1618207 RepID=UPI000699165D|nr:DUF1870 family protein [Psychromicrobium lacuslunae]
MRQAAISALADDTADDDALEPLLEASQAALEEVGATWPEGTSIFDAEILYDFNVEEAMTAAELKVVREYLGLTREWCAEYFDVALRQWNRYESSETPIPARIREGMEHIEAETAENVGRYVEALEDATDVVVQTYRVNADFWAKHPETTYSAQWHRAVIARVAQEVPGLTIEFYTPVIAAGNDS